MNNKLSHLEVKDKWDIWVLAGANSENAQSYRQWLGT